MSSKREVPRRIWVSAPKVGCPTVRTYPYDSEANEYVPAGSERKKVIREFREWALLNAANYICTTCKSMTYLQIKAMDIDRKLKQMEEGR